MPNFCGGLFDYDNAKQRQEELAVLTADPALWDNQEKALKLTGEKNTLDENIAFYEDLLADLQNSEEMVEMAEAEEDEAMLAELFAHLEELKQEAKRHELEALLSGELDKNDAYLEVHAGSGGTEAQDWAEMLLRMYSRWAEKHKYKLSYVEETEGEVAGLKSATVKISGHNAYGWLKGESGVHRLVRISPFDSNARRHTSFCSVDVFPELDDDIEVEIDETELRIDTYRSSGAGGQNVNKTSSAVRMTHYPTGIVVSCQTERDQVQNRATCIKMLKAKLLELRERAKEEEMANIKGEMKKIEWGSQIRSYVFQPYTMVKDHRTNYESGNIDDVMDGNLEGFITAYLKMQ